MSIFKVFIMSQIFCIGYFGLFLLYFCKEDIFFNFREDEKVLMVNGRVRMQIEIYEVLFNKELVGEREFKEIRVMDGFKYCRRWEKDWIKSMGEGFYCFFEIIQRCYGG